MKKLLKGIGVALLVLFAGIQLILPERTNPPVEPDVGLAMHSVFRRACADCHSNETRWPWYSYVAPTSWFVAGHINHARSHLNVSEWSRLEPREATHKLAGMCKMVKRRSMPLPSYLLIHRDARLSDAEIDAICEWAQQERSRIAE